jgi:hypothetical protein
VTAAGLPGVVKADVDVEASRDYERTRLLARGLGLGGSAPGWEFTRAPGRLPEGSWLLELVVQAAGGAPRCRSAAWSPRRRRAGCRSGSAPSCPRRAARAELPAPLEFSGDT